MQGKFLVFFPFIPSLSTTSSAARTLPKALFYYLSSPFLFLPHLTLTLSIIKNPTQIRASPAYTLYYIIMQYARRFLPKKTKKRRTSTVIFRRFWRLIMVATTIIMRGPSNGLQRGSSEGAWLRFTHVLRPRLENMSISE